jgi:glycosyltransferase involved in cell wall biosynthesis
MPGVSRVHNERTVSVVLPAYNEEGGIGAAIEGFFATGVVDEVVVVNNNSTDRTAEEAGRTSARVVLETRQGYGAALTRGLTEATGDLIVLAEPDGTFVSNDIYKLLAYADDFEMVCGTRTTRELIWSEANMGWLLRVGNFVLAKLIEVLYNTCSLSDCGCTFRLVHRRALHRFHSQMTVTGSHFLPEMLILARLANVKMIEIPLNYRQRTGVSKITGTWSGAWTTGINMLKLILKYRVIKPR